MEKVVYQDLYQFNFLSDVVISPDGFHAVFSKHNADEEKNGYTSELWIIQTKTGNCQRLTCGGDERGAFWLDEQTVAFSTGRGKKAGQKKSIWYKIAITGGEAEKFLEINEKVSSITPIGNGKYLVVSPQHCEGMAEEKENAALEGRDLYVFDELPFWVNGQGIRNKIRNTLMLFDENTKELTTISPQYLNVNSMHLSENKRYAAYAGALYTDVMLRPTGLYLYDLVTGDTKTVFPQQDVMVGTPYFMGNDTLFFSGITFKFAGVNPRYYIYDIPSAQVTMLPFCDASPSASIGTDCNYGAGNAMKYIGDKLYFLQTNWGNAKLVSMDKTGAITPVCATAGSITSFDIHGSQVLMTAMRGVDLIELWSLDMTTGAETQLTHFNSEYMRTHTIVQPERFTFMNSAGIELEGFVIKPVNYEPGMSYPAIFEMHGGPKVAFGSIFHHEMQCFANQGYFVFYTNPRGSDGRGEDFANITNNLGYIDFADFMEFNDEVLRRYPDIDEKHIGICGGSYGGFMCNWMIGHTDRYAAAASQRSISNYFSKGLCTDIGFTHNMAQLGTDLWESFETVWEHSPLKCAPNAKTPTLFIQSDEDYRCWMSDALQMFTALKMNGVDSRLVLFHGENHELSRSGKPQNRITRLSEIGNWFEKYLKI